MTKEILNVICISDIHLGARRNKTADIIANLNIALPFDESMQDIDIIFLAGDVFDSLLSFNDEVVVEIQLWIDRLLRLCSKYNIMLKVLEGTPSHDRQQSETFLTIHQVSKYPVVCDYIKTLSIEYITEFDIHILYIPDEWDVTTARTLQQVKDLMKSKGLSKVDFAIMHGIFPHQLASHIKNIPIHDPVEYLNLVKHYIFIGHIHKFSVFDRILAEGSFDRLSHGEEEPKGFLKASVNLVTNERNYFFIENTGAKIFKTFQCYYMDIQSITEYLKEKVKDLPNGANVRIEANHDNLIFSNMNVLVSLYPTINWSKLPKTQEELEQVAEVVEDIEYMPIDINKSNIVSLLMDRVNSLNLDRTIHSKTESVLKELVNG